ncbi:Tyrosine-protein kinase transmembrane receptor Ror [Gryllus bimaculatus]|nr:Tyrosine-protein kinase transmembrane receptor Ror [Gryllus bimaculatus]
MWASKVRFLPYSYHRRTVCMRVELYGCYWSGKCSPPPPLPHTRHTRRHRSGDHDHALRQPLAPPGAGRAGGAAMRAGSRGLVRSSSPAADAADAVLALSADGIVSYSMPQGDKRGAGWEFFDAAYDGHWDGELRRGLGQLTDGKVGRENFKMGYYDSDRGQGWVGWRNDSRGGQPVEIKFEFDRVREFTAVHLYCNNQFTRDVQVFSEANILFSVGGKFFSGEPITYTYIEDRIFESSRNISIKLHHRVGRFVKLQLHFAAKWIMLSEVTFDSDIAHGNFSPEVAPAQEPPLQSDVYVERKSPAGPASEVPVSTAKEEDHTYMAVVIGVLMAVIFLLAVAIYLIVSRHRQRKCFASPLAAKPTLAAHSGCSNSGDKGSAFAASYGGSSVEDGYGAGTLPLQPPPPPPPPPPPADLLLEHMLDVKLDDYQEPYQALKYAPYYSYSAVVMEMRDALSKGSAVPSDTSYDYAVPEMGAVPLLSPEQTSVPLPGTSDKDSVFSRGSSKGSRSEDSRGKKSPSQHEVLSALKRRLEQTAVPQFPRHRLRMLSKLAEGAFGSVYVAEADGIPEYGGATTLGKRLVAVKFLLQDATEREKLDFHRDVRILAALEDVNIARVLGMCSREEPLCVAMEYLEHGDLNKFLKSHVPSDDSRVVASGLKMLSFNCLLYMATQIASGMRYLETLNFVHRDLATRNCLVGKAYQIKISDFGTDNELYSSDYYKVDGTVALPVRWMAWESIFQGKYTTKSDVWAFAVTLWEILQLARRVPFVELSDPQVLENLAHLQYDDGKFCPLPRPPSPACTKDIYDLMCECWRRHEAERPSFREIHLFLQRKNLGYTPLPVS